MSELTMCNYCSLGLLKKEYGEDNVRTVPSDSREMPIEVQVKKNGEWKGVAWFAALTDRCAC